MAADLLSPRAQALELIKEYGYEHRDTPFRLASGQLSHDYIDVKFAIDRGARLHVVSVAMLELASSRGIEFTHVGGPTMGADALACGMALVGDYGWFSVRKEAKTRGREQWIEGARLGAHDRVLLVEDAVTTGGSILTAYERVIETGATVVGAMPMVDRGDQAGEMFAGLHIPYAPLITYQDLGIDRVGQG